MRRIQEPTGRGGYDRAKAPGATQPPWSIRSNRAGRYDRKSVVCAAVDVFNIHGFDATSMGLIADRLGVTRAALYHHVSSKEELLRLALNPLIAGLDRITRSTARPLGSPLQQLQTDFSKLFSVLIDNLPATELLLQLRGNTEFECEVRQRFRAMEEHFRRLIYNGMVDGSVRDQVDPWTAAQYLVGLLKAAPEALASSDAAKHQIIEQTRVVAFLGLMPKTSVFPSLQRPPGNHPMEKTTE